MRRFVPAANFVLRSVGWATGRSFGGGRGAVRRFALRVGLMLLACALGVGDITASAGQNASKRPFRIDDRFDAEDVKTPVFSPDGQAVIFTRRRAASSQVLNPLAIDETRDDLWLQAAPGKEVRNLTNGAKDASGAWDAKWSADGAYLSFLSSRGGKVTAWVWDRRADTIRQLSPAGIEFRGASGGCRWLPDNKLLCATTLDGQGVAPTWGAGEAIEFATGIWEKVRRGELATSAVNSTEFRQEACRLQQFDLAKGTSSDVATILFDRGMTSWWPSPDGKVLAFVRHESSV
jgi:dipeptidyl aminopeptidase/acylaminoacyl peptidase